jgi:hypothetical protein
VLLLVTAVVGWFGLRGGRTHRRPLAVRALVLLLSLASAASAWTFLLKLDGAVRTAGRNATVGDLTRGLAVVRALVPPDSVEAVRSMTGFQATLVSHHRVEATTLTGTREGAAAIAAIRPPPPSFTASGPVTTSAGPSIYVALSLPRGDLLVVTAPSRREPITIFRRCAILIAACLALWLLGTSAIAWRTGLLSS